MKDNIVRYVCDFITFNFLLCFIDSNMLNTNLQTVFQNPHFLKKSILKKLKFFLILEIFIFTVIVIQLFLIQNNSINFHEHYVNSY